MAWLLIAEQLAPLILGFIPQLRKHPEVVAATAQGIQIAEGIPGATGPQKKDAVVQLVSTGIQTANTVSGSTVIDHDSTVAAVSAGIDATIATINAIHSIGGKK